MEIFYLNNFKEKYWRDLSLAQQEKSKEKASATSVFPVYDLPLPVLPEVSCPFTSVFPHKNKPPVYILIYSQSAVIKLQINTWLPYDKVILKGNETQNFVYSGLGCAGLALL